MDTTQVSVITFTFMSLPADRFPAYSYDEYRAFEDANPARHEFVGGQILGMAGGTPAHARLQAAVLFALEQRLTGSRCQAFPSDLRVRVQATGMATYPDVTVICGDVATDPRDSRAATNPILIVEVLSDSTGAYDRGEKFEHYRQIPSLQTYMLVSHRERRIDFRQRTPDDRWTEQHAVTGQSVSIPGLGIELSVDEVYDRSPLTSTL